MKNSVIIPAHNPKASSLLRVISALKMQSLPLHDWELIIVDNDSHPKLQNDLVEWHPNGKLISEPIRGLTFARICGIKESTAKSLVFVDDDNILQSDYLESVNKLREAMPKIGAFSGNIEPEFEVPPPKDMYPYLNLLAIRKVDRAIWGNNYPSLPITGAGMVIDVSVGKYYVEEMQRCPERLKLDRIGSSLNSFGDVDLAWCACDLDMGIGVFPELNLTHIIPKERLNHEYLQKLAMGVSCGSVLMQHFRGNTPSYPSRLELLINAYKVLRCTGFQRKMLKAEHQGKVKAFRDIKDITMGKNWESRYTDIAS